MSNIVKKGCGCWIVLSVASFLILLCLYLFSDGSEDAAKNIELGDVDMREIYKYVARDAQRSETLYKSLSKNDIITNLSVSKLSLPQLVAEHLNIPRLLIRMNADIQEMEKYLDLVRVSFLYKNSFKVDIDILVLKGQLFAFLDKDMRKFAAPWAQALGIVGVKEKPI